MSESKIPRQSISNVNNLTLYCLAQQNDKTTDTLTWDVSSIVHGAVWFVSDHPIVADSVQTNWNVVYASKTVTVTKPTASSGGSTASVKVMIAFG